MNRYIIVTLALAAAGCTSTNFVKTGFDQPPAASPGPCDAVVLQKLPEDHKYVELGFCTTSMPGGGMITDKTPAAIRELQKCACEHGGNAIVYAGDSESGVHTGFGYSQQHIKARATVLFVYPQSSPQP